MPFATHSVFARITGGFAVILLVIFVVLMILWLAFGCYSNYEPARPIGLGNTLIPWVCVAILGYVLFGGGVVMVAPAVPVR